MGRRRYISEKKQAKVLVRCRRRCCICFALHRDFSIKRGQIAHLDHDPANNDIDNLAFLCLEHHDEYDSKTRLSKGFTLEEVKRYREELYDFLKFWLKKVPIGEIDTTIDSVEGMYVRDEDEKYAELEINLLTPTRIRVKGYALWGTSRECPHIGELDFESDFDFENKSCIYSEKLEGENKLYRIRLTFETFGVVVEEENASGHFGMNVSFTGRYIKVKRNE